MAKALRSPASASLEAARAAKPAAIELLAQLGERAAVGITRIGDGFGLKINVPERLDEVSSIPVAIDGVPVRLAVVGRIRRIRKPRPAARVKATARRHG